MNTHTQHLSGSNYEMILAQQKISGHDICEHLTGPVIAFLIHLFVLPAVITMVVIERPVQEPEIQVEAYQEELVVPEKVEEIPLEQEIPDPQQVIMESDRPDITPDEEPNIENQSIEDMVVMDIPNITPFQLNNSAKTLDKLYAQDPFGNRTSGNGTGGKGNGGNTGMLEGTFYDLKQTAKGQPLPMPQGEFLNVMRDFVNHGWNTASLQKYYRSPTKLAASRFYIPQTDADNAPAAYQCADKVKTGRWAAIYRGRVAAPKSGTFRFAGAGDDALLVRFNNQNVFDFGWYQLTIGKLTATPAWHDVMSGKTQDESIRKELTTAGIHLEPVKFYPYSSTPNWNNSLGGIATGKTFTVNAGEIYPIEILISEIPGGKFGAALLIEEVKEGTPEQTDTKTGSPILPLFRTNPGLPDPDFLHTEAVPFMPGGPIWKVVPKNFKGNKIPVEEPLSDDETILIL